MPFCARKLGCCWAVPVPLAGAISLVVAIGSLGSAGCRRTPKHDLKNAQQFVKDLSALRALRLSVFGEFGSSGLANEVVAEEAQVDCALVSDESKRGGGARPRIVLCDRTIGALEVIPPPLPAPRIAIDDLRRRAAARIRADVPKLGEEEIQDYLRRNSTTAPIAAGALREAGCPVEGYTVGSCELDASAESDGSQSTRLLVSRPGLNKAKTHAVIYVSRRGEYDERAGVLLLFERAKTGWIKVASTDTWVM